MLPFGRRHGLPSFCVLEKPVAVSWGQVRKFPEGFEVLRPLVFRDLFKGKVKDLRKIGDCLAPRRVINAIYEGYKAGMEI